MNYFNDVDYKFMIINRETTIEGVEILHVTLLYDYPSFLNVVLVSEPYSLRLFPHYESTELWKTYNRILKKCIINQRNGDTYSNYFAYTSEDMALFHDDLDAIIGEETAGDFNYQVDFLFNFSTYIKDQSNKGTIVAKKNTNAILPT